MSVVPETLRTPRMPTAITSVIPSCLRRRRRKKLIEKPSRKGLLTKGVPQDDVVNEAPCLPSLVRVYVHVEVHVQERTGGSAVGRVREGVAIGRRDVVRDHDGRA